MPASKEYFQEYYLTRKRKLMVALGSEDYACVQRGYRGDDLEFDHIDRETKSFTIGTRIMQGWKHGKLEEILEELKKCQLLCTGCHLKKTVIQMRGERGWTHGTMYGWMKKHCACDACVKVKREFYDDRKAKRHALQCDECRAESA